METAYDPARIHQLSMRTVMAIDALSMLSSPDPLAADAMRSLRLLRRNLEEMWMPLLRQIETSQAMITWTSSAAMSFMGFVTDGRDSIAGWIERHDGALADHLRSMTDDEFLVQLALIGDEGLPFDGHNGLDLDDPRVGRDVPDGRRRDGTSGSGRPTLPARVLVDVSSDNPVVGLAMSYASFPTSFVHDVAVTMLQQTSRMDDFETRAEAAAASAALEALVDDPQVCLTALQDPALLAELAGWTMLDQDVVARFVQSGLHTAVVDETRPASRRIPRDRRTHPTRQRLPRRWVHGRHVTRVRQVDDRLRRHARPSDRQGGRRTGAGDHRRHDDQEAMTASRSSSAPTRTFATCSVPRRATSRHRPRSG